MRTLVAVAALFLVALVTLRIQAVSAADAAPSAGDQAQVGSNDNGGHTGNAECPIKKTINGKLYCFQNNPALTKRQGGGN
jgi:hypothetical protein